MTYRPEEGQLRGLSYEVASKYGMPHLGCFYSNSRIDSHRRHDGAPCAVCGKIASNAHHDPPRRHGLFVMETPMGAFVLRPALIAVCGSGTTGCHNGFHGGARYEARWEWLTDEAARKWWSGWFLSHGYEPHDPRLYQFGCWLITDFKTGRTYRRDARTMEALTYEE